MYCVLDKCILLSISLFCFDPYGPSYSFETLVCKNQSQDSIFQPFENLYYENFSLGLTKVSLIVDSGYMSLSSTFSVSSASKIS